MALFLRFWGPGTKKILKILIFDIPTVPPIQISTEKGQTLSVLSKFLCRTILMHVLLLICGKFTGAQLAHQIFIQNFCI
jgi:hypothetical protein